MIPVGETRLCQIFQKPTTASLPGSKTWGMELRGQSFWGFISRLFTEWLGGGISRRPMHTTSRCKCFCKSLNPLGSKSIERWEPGVGQPPFRAWLTTIARNAITKALIRRPHDQATGTTSVAELLAAQPEPEATASEFLAEARREIIRWATEQIRAEFSDEIWKLFQWTAIDGVSIAQVAESSGRSVGSIYSAAALGQLNLVAFVDNLLPNSQLEVLSPDEFRA